MLSFTGGLKIFVALEPCDMCKGFGSLSRAMYDQLKEDVQKTCATGRLMSLPTNGAHLTVIEAGSNSQCFLILV